MIHLKDGSIVPVEKVNCHKLPEDINLNQSGNPLENHRDWKKLFIKKLESPQQEKQIL